MKNLATLLRDRATQRPTARFGLHGDQLSLRDFYARAQAMSRQLVAAGVGPTRVSVLIGTNSTDWLVTWAALQLAGSPTVLANPSMPDSLLSQVLAPLSPYAVLSTDDRAPNADLGAVWIDPAKPSAAQASVGTEGATEDLPGFGLDSSAVCGYMLTSGTSGPPKLVAQSHEYMLSLGRYVADTLCLTTSDVVLTALPLFHINPLGYAVMGALSAGADCVAVEKFSASGFWPLVLDSGATAVVLHGPPMEILKRRTSRQTAVGHRVRVALYAEPEFLRQFDIPLGVSVYGSTEGGGLSHAHYWRPSDVVAETHSGAHVGGAPRPGFAHRISHEGEIHIHATAAGELATGYVSPDGSLRPVTVGGWYQTGDMGYEDQHGHLVFTTRGSESIRARGEFVPIQYVEQRFQDLPDVRNAAIWKRPGKLPDEDEIVLYLECDAIPEADVRASTASLPPFMRPVAVARLAALPVDSGVGKVRRRLLVDSKVLEMIEL